MGIPFLAAPHCIGKGNPNIKQPRPIIRNKHLTTFNINIKKKKKTLCWKLLFFFFSFLAIKAWFCFLSAQNGWSYRIYKWSFSLHELNSSTSDPSAMSIAFPLLLNLFSAILRRSSTESGRKSVFLDFLIHLFCHLDDVHGWLLL